MKLYALITAGLCTSLPAYADPPEIIDVSAKKSGMGWRFDVTLKHPDTGWDHYADGWEVLDGQGNQLGYRVLHHPHVNEQPFTRSLSSVMLPDGTREVFVRARCTEGSWTPEPVRVTLNR